jgi:hypothetical protein
MKACNHTKICTHTGCFRPIVARKPNPIAHGNITETEMCLTCGARRETNRNAGQMETTGWKGGNHA